MIDELRSSMITFNGVLLARRSNDASNMTLFLGSKLRPRYRDYSSHFFVIRTFTTRLA